ncbi:glycosyltransferase family 4 protein [Gordonia polyisoprenivorans]|uniref:Glycosyltransferase family 4 protein n=1 Tax=Gordonia polyisoprenivorans TaxID=84595 RepID=A0A846WHP0_9ACTN|nr:glycosyltransferase family 4 protein [Gordonia polyisoprenivorans]
MDKLLDGVVDAGADFEIYWPMRADCSVVPRSSRVNVVRGSLPMMDLSLADGSQVVLFLKRLNIFQRHDAAFVRWCYRYRPYIVLVEEHQRFTLWMMVCFLRFFGCKVVMHLHNTRRHSFADSLGDRVDEVLLGVALRRCDAVVVHDQRSANIVSSRYRAPHCSIVPHGVDSRKFAELRPRDLRSVLFFGEYRKNKGLAVLVDAMCRLSDESFDCELIVAGRVLQEDRDEVVDLLSRVSSVRWIDRFIEDSELDDLFSGCGAVVLPYVDFEAQSGILHLAIAYGLPVVVSDVGGMRGVVEASDIGLVVGAADASALSAAIRQVLSPEVNARCRSAARMLAGQLSWANAGRSISSLCVSCCSKEG